MSWNSSNAVAFVSTSPEETRSMAVELAARLSPGDLVALNGDLGAGKTVLAQGLARGLGVPGDQVVRSPTFSLFNIHLGPTPFVHADLYRIEVPDEVEALGLLDLLPDHVVAVEWFEQAQGLLGVPVLVIEIADVDGAPTSRSIRATWNEGQP